jgi:hypothetical protein
MIDIALVDAVFVAIGTSLGITFVRANQDFQKLPYPYATYNIIGEQAADPWEWDRIKSINAGDPTLTDITTRKRSAAIISVTFIDKNDYDEIQSKIREFWNFFDDTTIDFEAQYGITPQIISPNIEDRTTVLDDNIWEYRKGFDIQFKYCDNRTVSVERMQKAEIDVTVDDTPREKLLIDSTV